MFANYLASVLPQAHGNSSKDLWKDIDKKMHCYANGELDHAMDTMTLLWKLSKGTISSSNRPRKVSHVSPLTRSFTVTNLGTHPQPDPPSTPANWERVEMALIKSIRQGAFFDKRYWTRQSKTGRALRPVYLSSIIAGERLQYVNRCE